ncbi:MAG TPA: tyrosine-type recombinase/integrase [Sphingomonadaceae bacterium]|nr:tyrosine-type recombinase/integrase [Sphingomonadaceae bacterium]
MKKLRKAGPPIWYIYAYRGGPQIYRQEGWSRPALGIAELRRLVDQHDQQVERLRRNTLGELIADWRASPEWRALAKSTQRTWGSELNRIEQKWKDTPLSVWNDPRMAGKVMGWRNSRASTPRSADFGVTVLRALLKFGRLNGRLSINVAADIPQLYKAGSRAEIVWSEEDLEAFDRSASELGARHVYLAVKLAALTGLRREDLVTLRWEEIKDHAIVKKALKASRGKRRIATIPKLPVLQELLDVLASLPRKEGVDTVLVNLHGKPWTADGFGTSFIRVRDHAKISHFDPDTGETKSKHLHDLRGTFCTKLILAGLSDQEAADIMGWSPQQVSGIRRTYVDQSSVAVAIGRRLKGHL